MRDQTRHMPAVVAVAAEQLLHCLSINIELYKHLLRPFVHIRQNLIQLLCNVDRQRGRESACGLAFTPGTTRGQ